MENYEIKKYLDNFSSRIDDLEKALDTNLLMAEIEELEQQMMKSDFWDNHSEATIIVKKVTDKKNILKAFNNLSQLSDELNLYNEMHLGGEEDALIEIKRLVPQLEKQLDEFEIDILLSGEYDDAAAFVELHPGAGGTESMDWTSILYRMYRRYAERKGFKFELIDYQEGEEAGIKSVSFVLEGHKAYGYLRGEQGVHRLVRISPFDSNARRHTSFCACSVTPYIKEEIDIEIKQEDIRIDTYRASGAGGQHVNTTDSAIRITHLPTGIVVTCQNQRSQIQNREQAMKILRSKLLQKEIEEQEAKIQALSGAESEISFGSQIRSYVFHPYSMVKDHRTNLEISDINGVVDGNLDPFINAYLKYKISKG